MLGINSKNSFYRYEIDGLRAIAVLSVIINHFNKDILPSGYLGVDIFFVISGYVITASLVRRENKNFLDYIISFYERRIKRIIPSLTIFVVITSIIICIFNPFPIFNLRTGFASLFGVSNILLFISSDGYFTPSSNLNPFTHTWSLSVEEQFYFFYPLLAWFTGYSRNKKNSYLLLSIILLILSISSLFLFVYYYPKNQNAAYFLMPNRFWEISAGCLTFIGISKKLKIIKYVKNLNSNYIFILLISSFFIPLKGALFATLVVVLLTSLTIISIKSEDFIYGFLTNKYILKIGLLSYSLYLWHWGIISLSEWTIGIYWWTIPFQLIAIFYISLLSFNFVEKPFINHDYKSKLKSFLYGITLILFSQATILYLGTNGKRLLYAGDISDIYNRDLSARTIFFNECNLSRNNLKKIVMIKNCSYSINSLKKRIFIIGDSHANMFFNAFKTISRDNYALSRFTGNGCSFPVLEDNSFNKARNCSQMKDVEKFIQENIKSGDIIFLANSRYNQELLNLYSRKDINKINIKFKNYLDRLNKFSKMIINKEASIYYLVNPPTFQGVTDAYCSPEWFRPKRFVKKECYLERSKFEEPRNKVINFLLKNNNDINLIYDYLDFICDKNICNASGYIDSNHIIEDLSFKILVNDVSLNEIHNSYKK
tara:strand:+ start:44 stop:2008 length:1965 start_codon:yes stop_codon:yes gene_type:complete